MSYGVHTELELAKVCKPDWLRSIVWEELHAQRERTPSGAPETVTDHTGEEQDGLWLQVGIWTEAIAKRHPTLTAEDGPRIRRAFTALRGNATSWPEGPSALWGYLQAELAAGETLEPARITGTGGEAPREPLPRESRKAKFRELAAGLRGEEPTKEEH